MLRQAPGHVQNGKKHGRRLFRSDVSLVSCLRRKDPKMNSHLIGRGVAMFAAAAALALGVGMTPALASPQAPDTCSALNLCVWNRTDFRGKEVSYPTSTHKADKWYSLTAGGNSLPWGSFRDNSNSSVAFGDATTGKTRCYVAGDVVPYPASAVRSYRYFHIEYGISNCTGTLPPLP
jgi:hypothetical protein